MPLKEADVGITETLGSHRPFRAILKQNIDDFVVNEVLLSGETALLTTFPSFRKPATVSKDEKLPSTEERPAVGSEGTTVKIPYSQLDDMLPNPSVGLVSELVSTAVEADEAEVLLPSCSDKAKRTAIHTWVRENLPAYLTDTVEQDGGKAVRLRKRSAFRPWQRRAPKRQRTADGWVASDEKSRTSDAAKASTYDPRDMDPRAMKRKREMTGGEGYVSKNTYVSFVLWKRNADTIHALNALSRALRVSSSAFTFAGTKDKRAVTTQKVHIRGISEERFAHANCLLRKRNSGGKSILVGNIEVLPQDRNEPLKLGDLMGNRFTLALRDLDTENDGDEMNVRAAVDSLRSKGFVNYFGLQRFGSGVSGTHETGFAFLREDFEDVCLRILLPLDIRNDISDEAEIRPERLRQIEALQKFQKREVSAKELLGYLPQWMHIERAVVQSFVHDENRGVKKYDYRAAFQKLPLNMRRMYGHAVQSYLWNIMASHRIRMCPTRDLSSMYGLKGDLILVNEEDKGNLNFQTQVRQVTEEEEKEKSVSIFSVLIPVLGSDVPVPDIEYGKAAREVLRLEGIDLEGRISSEYCMKGTYRFLLAKPRKVDVDFVSYTDNKQVLIPQALIIDSNNGKEGKSYDTGKESATEPVKEEMLNTDPTDRDSDAKEAQLIVTNPGQKNVDAPSIEKKEAQLDVTDSDQKNADAPSIEKKALIISFTLGCAEYATMLVRELTRKDSSTENQRLMQSNT